MSCLSDGIKDVSDFFSGVFTSDESKKVMEGLDLPNPKSKSIKKPSVSKKKKVKRTDIPTDPDEPEPEDTKDSVSIGKNDTSKSCDPSIEKAYFAKKKKVGKAVGTKTYKFRGTNTITDENKKEIALIIKKRIKSSKKYTTVKQILKIMPNKKYIKGNTLSIPLFESKELICKVDKSSLGSKVFLVVETKGFKNGESVKVSIYEKEKMIVGANEKFPFLKDKIQKVEVSAPIKVNEKGIQKATVEISLRPKHDKKLDDTTNSGSLEAWKAKFKKENEDDDDKKDFLWLKVQYQDGELKEKEFLKGGELEVNGCNIEQKLLTKNKYSRPGTKLGKVKAIVIHWVANPNSKAISNRNFFESRKNGGKNYGSAHYIIGLEGEILQCLPDDELAYHVGAKKYTKYAKDNLSKHPNNCTIGIELTHTNWAGEFKEETLDSAVCLCRKLLADHGLTSENIIRHYDVTGKDCPKYFVNNEDKFTEFKNRI